MCDAVSLGLSFCAFSTSPNDKSHPLTFMSRPYTQMHSLFKRLYPKMAANRAMNCLRFQIIYHACTHHPYMFFFWSSLLLHCGCFYNLHTHTDTQTHPHIFIDIFLLKYVPDVFL